VNAKSGRTGKRLGHGKRKGERKEREGSWAGKRFRPEKVFKVQNPFLFSKYLINYKLL
jgi:hypothetical protein